jgi:hypothetical protein
LATLESASNRATGPSAKDVSYWARLFVAALAERSTP